MTPKYVYLAFYPPSYIYNLYILPELYPFKELFHTK